MTDGYIFSYQISGQRSRLPVILLLAGIRSRTRSGLDPSSNSLRNSGNIRKVFKPNMTEIKLKKGEPVEKALRRFKKKLDREQTLQQVRLHRRVEKPSAKKRRKTKAARFAAMLKERYADQ